MLRCLVFPIILKLNKLILNASILVVQVLKLSCTKFMMWYFINNEYVHSFSNWDKGRHLSTGWTYSIMSVIIMSSPWVLLGSNLIGRLKLLSIMCNNSINILFFILFLWKVTLVISFVLLTMLKSLPSTLNLKWLRIWRHE